jgi:hypothetical protein
VAVDLDLLADRVLQLVHDPALRHRMRRAGRDKVAAEYVWSRVISRYLQVWAELRAAAAAPGGGGEVANPNNLPPVSLFSHYSSRLLTDEVEVLATDDPLAEGPCSELAPWLPGAVISEVTSAARDP